MKRVIDSFLNGLAVVEARKDLSDTQQARVTSLLVSAPKLYTPKMVTALCDTVTASEKLVSVLTDTSVGVEEAGDRLKAYQEVVNTALYQEMSERGSLLREGIGGAPEADTIRRDSINLGLALSGMTRDDSLAKFYDLAGQGSSLSALRFNLESMDQTDRAVSMEKMTLLRFLGEMGRQGDVHPKIIDQALNNVGPGGVSVDHLRTLLGEGVHGQGGVVIEEGFNMDGALSVFDTNINEDMGVVSKDPAGLREKAPQSLVAKASYFYDGFLTDFFRNGIMVGGDRILGSGTQDYGKMEAALDKLISKFPSAQEAGRVTRPLFQSLGATIMISLMSDPVTSEPMMKLNACTGKGLSDFLTFDIRPKEEGVYDVRVDMGTQKDSSAPSGNKTDGLGMSAGVDMTVTGADRDDPRPLVETRGFDFVFGRI
ncbi:MAG: hypothetical protein HUN05_06165 [Desulfobacter sp.]|nr:MAG: hypothetical protein HUN05_06165 [Desulfobacter sp.]